MIQLKHGSFVYQTSETLSRDEVQMLKNWCDMVLSFRSDLQFAFWAVSESMNALANGKFFNMSVDGFWKKGFEVTHENCMAYETDAFFSIYDPETSELDIHAHGEEGLVVRVNAASGGVQLL